MEQADEGVSGEEIELDVGERFELVAFFSGGDEREEEPELGDFRGLFHQVHAVEVLGDDFLFQPIGGGGFVLLALELDPLEHRRVGQRLATADEGGVEIEQGFQRGDEEGTGAAGGVEQREARQDVLEDGLANGAGGVEQQILDGVVTVRRGEGFRLGFVEFLAGLVTGVDAVEHELMDGLLAEVIGDFRTGVVGSEFLLVDVFLEDVAEHVGIDLAVIAAGGVVERPRVAAEEGEKILEDGVWDFDLGVGLGEKRLALDAGLDAMGQEQAAIEVGNVAEWDTGNGFSLAIGFGEALEEEIAEEVAEEAVFPGFLGRGEFFREVGFVAILGAGHIEEAFLLEKPDEHQSVQQDGGIPTAFAGIGDALNGVEQLGVLLLEVSEEGLGDDFDVEACADAAGGLGDGDVAIFIELREIDDEGGELGEEQVAGLTFEIMVAAGVGFRTIALHPEPDGATALGIDEDENVFDGVRSDAFPDGLLGFCIRESGVRIGGDDFKNAETGELGNFVSMVADAAVLDDHRFRPLRVVPAEVIDEEIGELEGLKVFPGGAGVEFGSHVKIEKAISSGPRRAGSRG